MSTRAELTLQKNISQMISQNAQELHLSAGQPPMVRQDGRLLPMTGGEILTDDFLSDLAKTVLDDQAWQQLENQKAAVVIKEISSLGRLKISAYYQRSTLALTFRLIKSEIPKLTELGLPDSINRLAGLSKGLVLISGPLDSGRSTLAAAILQQVLNTRAVRVMTLENPTEHILQAQRGMVEQRQVGRDVPNLTAGLELLASEDVEVIYCADINTETAARANIQLALADRLVITTLSSDSAIRSLEDFMRLAGQDNKHLLDNLADALRAVVNLRLLPKQGMPGRAYVAEVLLNTPPLRLALKDGDFNRMQNILQTSRQEGMLTLDQSLLEAVSRGLVSKEAALAVAHDPGRLDEMLK